jgi:glutaredoxin
VGEPVKTVVLYAARDCHLCELARGELERLRVELGFELEEIDIGGVPELERRHRRLIPVVEIDGERVSVYRVDEPALRHKLGSN